MTPELSVVATSRNDDHGGNLAERTQYFIDGLADVADRTEISTELVLVEWNPPVDRGPLAGTLQSPKSDRFEMRVVTVPAELHQRFRHSEALPLFQMIAKNVGIRRSRGRMVLATNVDVVMSTALANALRSCSEGRTVYRCDRADLYYDVAASDAIDLDAVRATQPMRINRADGVHYPGAGRVIAMNRGLADLMKYRAGALMDRRRKPRAGRLAPSRENRERRNVGALVRDRWRALEGVRRMPLVHANACGDFTLIDRAGWDELRGYPEWEVYSWNLDSLLLFQAHAAGFDFVDLPPEAVLFHIEQSAGSAFTPEHASTLYDRIAQRGIRIIGDAELRDLALSLGSGRPPMPQFNGPDWGLSAHSLAEVTLS